MPRRLKSLLPPSSDIMARKSSINYAIAASAAPFVEPSEDELEEVFRILGMNRDNLVCVFCSKPTARLGHLNALVDGSRPTGWGTTIGNLVPVCSNCGSSRGNQPWFDWLQRKALDPHWPGRANVIETSRRLTLLEQRFPESKLDWDQLPLSLIQEFNERLEKASQALINLHELGRVIRSHYAARLLGETVAHLPSEHRSP